MMEETKYSHLAEELGGPEQQQQQQQHHRGVAVMTEDPDSLHPGVVVNLQMEVRKLLFIMQFFSFIIIYLKLRLLVYSYYDFFFP